LKNIDNEKKIFNKVDNIRIAIQRLWANERNSIDDGAALLFLGNELGKVIKEWKELISPEIEKLK